VIDEQTTPYQNIDFRKSREESKVNRPHDSSKFSKPHEGEDSEDF